MPKAMRLGIDHGSSSIGWALFALDGTREPERLIDAGVHIFSDSRDPESSDPLGKARREARQPRRRRDRYVQRKRHVMNELVRLGLMPADPAARKALELLDPYELRAAALDRPLHRHELGRILFQLQQRRGFQSNRLSDGDDKESGTVRESIASLEREMAERGSATLGAYWKARLDAGERIRSAFWTARDMLKAEFDAIVEAQRGFDPSLPSLGRLRGIIFHQRPLRPQEPGKCAIDGTSPRAPWALPIVQRFRILQELSNLRLTIPPEPSPRRLDRAQRDRLLGQLLARKEMAFERMRKQKQLGLPEDARFNLESDRRKKLDGDRTAVILAHKERFGKAWWQLPSNRQEAIVQRLIDPSTDDATLVEWLRDEHGLDPERAAKIAGTRLPQGHCHLGLPVIRAIVPIMEEQGLGYAEAAQQAGLHDSDHRAESGRDRLPYCGEILARWCLPLKQRTPTTPEAEAIHGRIANPTVHVGLNQLKKLVDALIERHGKPDEIHVELARDLKLGREKLAEIDAEQERNRGRNEEADDAMRAAGLDLDGLGKGTRAENRRRYRLWLELDEAGPQRRCCPYSGRPIGIRALFSAEVEIEHILPFSRTLDDSMANRTLAFIAANRDKGERTPFEAFHASPTINARRYDWEGIADRATRLPRNKAWRFAADAMQRFEKEGGFVERQLNDTTYLSRLTRLYLQCLYGKDEGDRVVALPGRLTGLLRRHWGLDPLLSQGNWKNREDHRHHAIDAAIIACTDRRTLQQVSRLGELERERAHLPPPYEGFRAELDARLRAMIVSHKREHGLGGALLKETAYGDTGSVNDKGTPLRVVRRPLTWLDDAKKLAEKLAAIRDPSLRQALRAHVDAETASGRKLQEALSSFRDPQGKPLRHVRTLEAIHDASLVAVANPQGGKPKLYRSGENAYMDVLRLPNGKWVGYAVSLFEANRLSQTPGAQPPWKADYPAAKRMMRLFKGDLVKLEIDNEILIEKVYQLWNDGRVMLAKSTESGQLDKRHKNEADPFRWLMPSASTFPKIKLRPVHVDILGHVREGGGHAGTHHRGDKRE